MKNHHDDQYLAMVNRVMCYGTDKADRTGTGTRSVFGHQMRFDISDGKLPLLTTKKVFTKAIIHELLWMLSGDTNVRYLNEHGVTIWNSWVKPETAEYRDMSIAERLSVLRRTHPGLADGIVADAEDMGTRVSHEMLDNGASIAKVDLPKQKLVAGELPKIYQHQWRQWEDLRTVPLEIWDTENWHQDNGFKYLNEYFDPDLGESVLIVQRKIDQIQNVIDQLKTNPDSRRIIVSAWNVADIEEMALPPCFPAGTLISTPNGYRSIEDIKVGDTVFSATMKPRRVNRVWKTPYHGELNAVLTNYSPGYLISTPNHPHMIADRGYVEAQKIEEGEKMVMPIRDTDIRREPHTFAYESRQGRVDKPYPVEYTLTIDDYFTLGYFMGNGWFMKNSDNRVCFAIPEAKKERILPRIRKSIKVSVCPGKDTGMCATYDTRSIKWAAILPDFGRGAPNKQIPEWMFNSPLDCIESFISGYLEADGYITPRNSVISYTTTSKKLAFGLQRLYAMFEKPLGISYQKRQETKIIEGRYVNQNDTYTCRVGNGHQRLCNEYHEGHMAVSVNDNFQVGLKNETFVYNLEVEDEHTYIANNMATHNCHTLFQFYTKDRPFSDVVDDAIYTWANDESNVADLHREEFREMSSDTQVDETWISATPYGGSGYRHPDYYTKSLEFYKRHGIRTKELSCQLYQRSADSPLGVPFNIVQYSLLTHMIAQSVGMATGEFIWTGGDCHVYSNQFEKIEEQLNREPIHSSMPKVKLNPEVTDLFDFTFDDIEIVDYDSHPAIRFPAAAV